MSLEGETNRTLILPAVNADRAGTYTLVASSSEGTALATMDLVVALRSPAPGQVDPAASVTLNPLAWVAGHVPWPTDDSCSGPGLPGSGRYDRTPGGESPHANSAGRIPDPTFAKLDPVDFRIPRSSV